MKKQDIKKQEADDVEWSDDRHAYKVEGLDERTLLRVYRFCKQHYEFWIGFVIDIAIVLFIIK
jgi:hypothetical protein